MTTNAVDLRIEARAEARRLACARALLHDGDEIALVRLEGDAAWIALSRRTALRRSMGRRACLVWRVAIEDAAGRIVESRLVPVLIDAPSDVGRVRTLLQELDGPIRERVERECGAWRQAAAAIADAFTSARLARERHVGERRAPGALSQPGLFDRRAERAHRADAAAAVTSGQATLERLRAVAASGAVASTPPRLLLVLVP